MSAKVEPETKQGDSSVTVEVKESKPKPKAKAGVEGFKLTTTLPLCTLFNPLAWMLIIIDILLIFVTLKWISAFEPVTHEVVKMKDGVVRQKRVAGGLRTEIFGCKTGYEAALRSFKKFANKPAMGTRTFLGMHKLEGARFPLKKFGPTTWKTYAEIGKRAHAFGSGLIDIGMKPLPRDEGSANGTNFEETKDPHTLLVYEETCADWMTSLLGAMSQSIVVATSYATLGVDAIVSAVNECNVKAILCNRKDVPKLIKVAKQMPTLTHLIYTNNYIAPDDAKTPLKIDDLPSGFSVLSMDDVVECGKKCNHAPTPPTPDNMAVIMYTSGSTGKPKGVMIRQKNIAASAAMFYDAAAHEMLEGKETYLAYLPAAHIFELIVEFVMLCNGARVGYSDPRSFSSHGAVRVDDVTGELHVGAKMKYPEDDSKNMAPGGLQSFRPSLLVAVPKIWDILKKGVEDGVSKKPAVLRQFVHFAYAWRAGLLARNMDSVIFRALFKKLFAPILGGRQKFFATGGGPIASEVQTFIRTLFCAPLIQGYALTETTCAGCVQHTKDSRDGIVGPPVTSVEIRLRDCTEFVKDADGKIVEPRRVTPSVLDRSGKPYLNADTSHYGEPVMGRGEVLFRGPSISAGYLKKPKKTKEEYDEDGWFHTGDIAIMLPDGCIKIVDRLKNLVKLKGGEYIAIESMEKEYSKSIFVNGLNGGIMCYGDGSMDRPVALVQVNVAPIKNWARDQGINVDDIEKMLQNDRVQKMVLADLNNEGKKGGVGRNEKLVAAMLISGNGSQTTFDFNSPWTPENGGLTASNKLQRRPILIALEDLVKPLIKKGIK